MLQTDGHTAMRIVFPFATLVVGGIVVVGVRGQASQTVNSNDAGDQMIDEDFQESL